MKTKKHVWAQYYGAILKHPWAGASPRHRPRGVTDFVVFASPRGEERLVYHGSQDCVSCTVLWTENGRWHQDPALTSDPSPIPWQPAAVLGCLNLLWQRPGIKGKFSYCHGLVQEHPQTCIGCSVGIPDCLFQPSQNCSIINLMYLYCAVSVHEKFLLCSAVYRLKI